MPYNLLIFPLISGYFFVNNCIFFRESHNRIDRQKLIFNSALAGVFLLLLAFSGKEIVQYFGFSWQHTVKIKLPLNVPFEGTMYATLLIAIVLTGVVNLFFRILYPQDPGRIGHTIEQYGNEMEKLLFHAFTNYDLLAFTLKSGKVYIGHAVNVTKPGNTEFIRIYPFISGYRETKNGHLHLDTPYEGIFKALESGRGKVLETDDFWLVLNKDEIISANLFDWEVFASSDPHKASTGTPTKLDAVSNEFLKQTISSFISYLLKRIK